jgi:hypothetical protein
LAPNVQEAQYPYCVKVETSTRHFAIPVAFLTPKEVEAFLQFDFKRLAQEAGVTAVRIHLERAMTADYEKVLVDIKACLRSSREGD